MATLSVSVWDRYKKERDTHVKRMEAVAARDALSARASELSEEIERLKTGRGIESELRSRFEVGAPGEKMIVIVDPEPVPTEPITEEKSGFFTWVKSWFGY